MYVVDGRKEVAERIQRSQDDGAKSEKIVAREGALQLICKRIDLGSSITVVYCKIKHGDAENNTQLSG